MDDIFLLFLGMWAFSFGMIRLMKRLKWIKPKRLVDEARN
jgi:hypothetical protein